MRFKVTCLFLLISARLLSQEIPLTDSIYFFEQTRRQLEASKLNSTSLLANSKQEVGQTSLAFDYSAGQLRNAQTPEREFDISFFADGIKNIGRFRLYGAFNYARIKQSNLAYSLRGEEINDQPFYYFAGKESDFSRQKYQGKGIISYSLIKDRLFLSSGFNYIYYLADRSVDPRMSLDWFDFKAQPELTYQTSNFGVGIGAVMGYGTENTGIKYKNIMYSGSTLYPERISYLNYGYGYISKGQTNFSRRKQYKGGEVHMTASGETWDALLNLNYLQSFDKNQQSLNASIKNQFFTDYTSDQLDVYFLITNSLGLNVKQLEVAYSILNGEDFVYSFGGRNYSAKNQSVRLNFSSLKRYGQKALEWGIEGSYQSVYKRDAVTDHSLEYTFIQPGVKTGYYLISKNYRISAILVPSITLPMNTNFTAPLTQEGEFTRGILYPELAYRKIVSGNLNLKLNYLNSKISKSFKTGVTLITNYRTAIKNEKIDFPAYFIPGNHRLSANLSLNLYF